MPCAGESSQSFTQAFAAGNPAVVHSVANHHLSDGDGEDGPETAEPAQRHDITFEVQPPVMPSE